MLGAQLSWERENWVARELTGWLKLKATDERVKPLNHLPWYYKQEAKTRENADSSFHHLIEWSGVPVEGQMDQHRC